MMYDVDPRSAGLQIAVIKVSVRAVCGITTSINVDRGGGGTFSLSHCSRLRWQAEFTGTMHEQ